MACRNKAKPVVSADVVETLTELKNSSSIATKQGPSEGKHSQHSNIAYSFNNIPDTAAATSNSLRAGSNMGCHNRTKHNATIDVRIEATSQNENASFDNEVTSVFGLDYALSRTPSMPEDNGDVDAYMKCDSA